MERERYIQPLEVISFFLENGGRATNVDLIGHFKPLLSKTLIGQENHAYLKRKVKWAIRKKIDKRLGQNIFIDSPFVDNLFQ